MKIRRWNHPDWDMALITADTEASRKDAIEVLSDDYDPNDLTFTVDEMSQAEFENLPEFEA